MRLKNLAQMQLGTVLTACKGNREVFRKKIDGDNHRRNPIPNNEKCVLCQQHYATDRAHILGVFDALSSQPELTVSDLNHEENIVFLCGTCHKLFDKETDHMLNLARELLYQLVSVDVNSKKFRKTVEFRVKYATLMGQKIKLRPNDLESAALIYAKISNFRNRS